MAHTEEHVLVIDDDRDLCELLTEYLSSEGFQVEVVYDGEKGIEKALAGSYGLIVLDVMLPGGLDGFEILRRLRVRIGTPVLMLTARGDDVDRIVGLELGADDYLPKPFNPRELVARMRAILRRVHGEAGQISTSTVAVRHRVGDVELEVGTRRVLCGGKDIELTAVEFELLEKLLYRAGYVVMREELTRSVLGRPLGPYDRSIDVHVSNLRKKLGRGGAGSERIKAVRGSGYIYLLPRVSG
ncbi:response regulator transcription factor [Syntrophus gentianae]|nr:response regulator transcription factor [Syntrophus gentianae]